jgi:hypothetical protein
LPSIQTQAEPLWLFAQVVEKDSLVAQVAMLYPVQDPSSGAAGNPELIVASSSGEQMGGMGTFCQVGKCVETVGVPMPGSALTVEQGEVLGLRSKLASNGDDAVTPSRFTARLYDFPADQAREGATLGGTFYFNPRSLPIFSTGEVPGRPFSVALPHTLRPGKYLLVLEAVWPEGTGPYEQVVYGFSLEVPPIDLPYGR